MTLTLSGTSGLSDVDGSAATPAIRGTDANTGIFFPAADTVGVSTGGSERVRVDSAGNFGLGVTPSAWGSGFKAVENQGGALYSGSTNANLISQNFYFNGTNNIYKNNGLASAYSQNSGVHAWFTAASGTAGNAITFTQAMTLDTSGNLLVGKTALPSASVFGFAVNNTNNFPYLMNSINTTGSGTHFEFYNPNGKVGSITTSGTATSYVTSSDYRLKENIAPMTGALNTVSQLKPVTYKWKVDGSDGQGFIAHELAEVCSQAVVGEKDAVDEEGNPQYQGIDTSFLVATLTAAIKEQQALIQSLTARITALEAK